LREDHGKFTSKGAVVLATGPDGPDEFRAMWARGKFPFRGIPDPDHRIAKLYEQRWRLLGLGRQPSVVVIDREGRIRSRHDGSQMWDLPSNGDVLDLVAAIST